MDETHETITVALFVISLESAAITPVSVDTSTCRVCLCVCVCVCVRVCVREFCLCERECVYAVNVRW